MSKREGELKSAFGRELKRRAPDFYILQYSTAGAPDREIIGNGVSTRWEMKHGDPYFLSPANQELLCERLSVVDHCRYVIWQEDRFGKQRTMIVHPREVRKRDRWRVIPEEFCVGFNHQWLTSFILKIHNR